MQVDLVELPETKPKLSEDARAIVAALDRLTEALESIARKRN